MCFGNLDTVFARWMCTKLHWFMNKFSRWNQWTDYGKELSGQSQGCSKVRAIVANNKYGLKQHTTLFYECAFILFLLDISG